jgi:2-polyprenyl-6-hydroxyphenyl methylase/3-demethylubiquinone-9 3-methyltransferase
VYYSDRSLYGHDYLLAKIEPIVAAVRANRIFDLGCGNGSIANRLSKHASVTGIDISDSGVQIANRSFPHLKIEVGSVYDDLAAKYGRFPVVVSLEVVEHLFDPPSFAKTLFDLVQPGGLAIVSTPYHGYWKNLAISLTGKFDSHFPALRVGGHIKFWSIHTLHIAGRGGIHGDRISARRQNPGARKVDDRNRTEILTLC